MIDLLLQAESEAALVAALPMLRGEDTDERPAWTAGPHHAIDAGIPIVTTAAVIDAEGRVTASAVLDPRFHANLRLDPAHPDGAGILSAAQPFVVTPRSPRRVFA